MATGDTQDVFSRLRRLLPQSWFPTDDDKRPTLNALLQGYVVQGSFLYSLIEEAQKQTRIETATGGFLDMIAADFLGTSLLRGSRSDDEYRTEIIAALLAERATRSGVRHAVKRLTNKAPYVIEPLRPDDTGAYASSLVAASANPSIVAYSEDRGQGGYYGSLDMPYQLMIQVRRKSGTGIPTVIGYRDINDALNAGCRAGAYHSLVATTQPGQPTYPLVTATIEWGSLDMVVAFVRDEEVYPIIEATRAAGVTVWVKFR